MATLKEIAASRQSAGATGLKAFTVSKVPTEWKPISVVQNAPVKITPGAKKIDVSQIQKPLATSSAVKITPGQKQLTPEQLNPIVGKQPTQTYLSQGKKPTVWDKISGKISELFDSTNSQKARAGAAVAVKQTVPQAKNIPLTQLEEKGGSLTKNTIMEDLTKELGIRNTPTTSEITTGAMTMAAGLGLITAPLATLKGIASFEAVSKISEKVLQLVSGNKNAKTFSDVVPNAPKDVKNLLDKYEIDYTIIPGNKDAAKLITKQILKRIK
jgi:hypothetical protein